MKQLELRYYSRDELSTMIGVDSKNQNWKRKIGNTLTNWGYGWSYGKKSFTITAIPTTAHERLAEIMVRKYDLDIQVSTYDFAVFTMCLLEDIDGFASMPWDYRSKYLNEIWNVNVASSTLRNWCNKLLDKNSVIKDKMKKTYWQSYKVGEAKYQEELENGKENPQWKKYWKRFFELKEEGCEDIGKTIYCELGYCVYSCATFAFSAFDDTDLLEDMLNLIAEIANSEAVDTVVSCKIEITEIPRASKDCMEATTKEEFEKCWKGVA